MFVGPYQKDNTYYISGNASWIVLTRSVLGYIGSNQYFKVESSYDLKSVLTNEGVIWSDISSFFKLAQPGLLRIWLKVGFFNKYPATSLKTQNCMYFGQQCVIYSPILLSSPFSRPLHNIWEIPPCSRKCAEFQSRFVGNSGVWFLNAGLYRSKKPVRSTPSLLSRLFFYLLPVEVKKIIKMGWNTTPFTLISKSSEATKWLNSAIL